MVPRTTFAVRWPLSLRFGGRARESILKASVFYDTGHLSALIEYVSQPQFKIVMLR